MKNFIGFSVRFGLQGGYLPSYHGGAEQFARRKDLADFIRNELAALDLPPSLFRQVKIRRLWSFCKRHGSSQATFHLPHGNEVMTFSGLTETEFQAIEDRQ